MPQAVPRVPVPSPLTFSHDRRQAARRSLPRVGARGSAGEEALRIEEVETSGAKSMGTGSAIVSVVVGEARRDDNSELNERWRVRLARSGLPVPHRQRWNLLGGHSTTQRGNRRNQAKALNRRPGTRIFSHLNAWSPRRKIKLQTSQQVRFSAPAQERAKGSCLRGELGEETGSFNKPVVLMARPELLTDRSAHRAKAHGNVG